MGERISGSNLSGQLDELLGLSVVNELRDSAPFLRKQGVNTSAVLEGVRCDA